MRTSVYVDGFNLYYRALKRTPYRWLDLLALTSQLVKPTNQITCIRYFTARVRPSRNKPDQHVKQDAYIRAIKAHCACLHVHEGQFYEHNVRMGLTNPPANGPRTVEVVKREEKGSDVNLAVHLLNDAWLDAYDVALVISNDSDLAEAIRLARARGKHVGVANPNHADKMNAELYNACSFRRRIERRDLAASLLPQEVIDNSGRAIQKPAGW